MAKALVIAGAVLLAIGIAWMAGEKLGLGRLPGDFVIERGSFRLYLPVTTSILLSVLLTLVFWLLGR